MEDLRRIWFPTRTCESEKGVSLRYKSVQLKYFGGMILALGVFICISFLLLGLEHFCYRHHRRVINPLQEKVQTWREAGRRNALVDPLHIQQVQRQQKKRKLAIIPVLKKKRGGSVGDMSIISDGEDELILTRMRMRGLRRDQRERGDFGPSLPPKVCVENEELDESFGLSPHRRSLSDIISVRSTHQSITPVDVYENGSERNRQLSMTPFPQREGSLLAHSQHLVADETEKKNFLLGVSLK